ncbi:NAD(P)H-flavin reductase [Zobellella denitrificans]|jgi:aquacobalamin reductase/NAD(P)H-flavin reductase|uniref:FMN reductase n=1 Tax=Zobellella denitrificans TaxID=347534 RepID=A0A231N0K0_9GAMM|nr:NAD(P)H-flavin reductase [Zobellella denitrificans]ATG75429.1 FMN reductase [Zobellella denitrificans]OXS15948.1 NAD(P)H-flavin reductase [Zobellella denitrificans]
MQKVTCSVEALEEMADTLWYVRLKPAQTVDFQSGQYLLVVMADDDKRPFSIANMPNEQGTLELHIGASPDNSYAMQVLTRMQEQGQIEVQLPAGKAYLRAESRHPVILMAGGTGFAYTRAILQKMLADGLHKPVFLYWGVRFEDHLYADAEMKAWAAEHRELTYVPVVQNGNEHWQGRTGLVHEAIMEDFPSLTGYDVYVAGRFEMAGVAREAFKEKGVEAERLFGDAYEFI